jgi:hypothetical protein
VQYDGWKSFGVFKECVDQVTSIESNTISMSERPALKSCSWSKTDTLGLTWRTVLMMDGVFLVKFQLHS